MHSSEPSSGSSRLSADKLKKRRDQNRISQRAFRLRKERHTIELEAKVEELENLLETASRENSMAASRMNKMEGELLYYRGLLSGASASSGPRTPFVTSFPSTESRSSPSAYTTAQGDIQTYGAGVPAYSYAAPSSSSSIPSLMAPALADEYQRAESYDSASSSSYSPAGEPPLEYSRTSPVDSSMWAYLQFNTAEPFDDPTYRE